MRLRQIARDRGWSLSEHGFTRIGEDGEPIEGEGAERRTFATEDEVYAFLGLALVAPELREDRGEIEAAQVGSLPGLVELDGPPRATATRTRSGRTGPTHRRRAEAARRRGYAYLVLTDHSQSLTIANGLTPARVEQQRRIIGELNERYAREEAEGEAPRRRTRTASGCSTGPRWRSASTAGSTTTTGCSSATTWSSRRCTSAAGSRASS